MTMTFDDFRSLREQKLYANYLRFLRHPQGYKSKKQVRKENRIFKKLNKRFDKDNKKRIKKQAVM